MVNRGLYDLWADFPFHIPDSKIYGGPMNPFIRDETLAWQLEQMAEPDGRIPAGNLTKFLGYMYFIGMTSLLFWCIMKWSISVVWTICGPAKTELEVRNEVAGVMRKRLLLKARGKDPKYDV